MVVRVSSSHMVHGAGRLVGYLSSELDQLFSSNGLWGNVACDVRVQKHCVMQNKDSFRVKLHLHGNRRFERVVHGEGRSLGRAVQIALRKLDALLARDHEKRARPSWKREFTRLSYTGNLLQPS